MLVTGILTQLAGTNTFNTGKARKSAFLEHEREPGRQQTSKEGGVDSCIRTKITGRKQQEFWVHWGSFVILVHVPFIL